MKSKLEWVVIRARPNQERKAAANVEHAGYDSYAPRFRQYGKIKPLFIGYAFARIPIKNWGFVKRIRGVRGVLMADDEPSIVRKDIIEEIKERQDDSGLVAMEKGFTLRQRVRIVGGAFSEGLYLGMSDKHRVRVLFELLGKELTKDINIKRVRPLEAHL